MTRRRWSEAERAQLIAQYPHMKTAVIAIMLGRTLSTVYQTARASASPSPRSSTQAPPAGAHAAGRASAPLRQGHVPMNKGVKRGRGWAPGRMAEGQFKKGEAAHVEAGRLDARQFRGLPRHQGRRQGARGRRRGWPSTGSTGSARTAPIPKGMVLRFIDGNPKNPLVENLEMVTREENLRLNWHDRYPRPSGRSRSFAAQSRARSTRGIAMSNEIKDLRAILFDTLRDLRDKEKPMDIDRAKAVAEVARELVNTAKVEVDHMKLTGSTGSDFIPLPEPKPGTIRPRLVKGRDMAKESFAMMTDSRALELALWLSRLPANSIHLECNGEHACNYMTAAQWIEGEVNSCTADDFKECAPDEIQRMKDTNTIWSLQIYKDTPNGFYRWVAPTMLEVIAKAKAAWPEICT
jgi:hypothetical protein